MTRALRWVVVVCAGASVLSLALAWRATMESKRATSGATLGPSQSERDDRAILSLYSGLSPEEKSAADAHTDSRTRALLIRAFAYKARASGSVDDIEPFLDEIEQCRARALGTPAREDDFDASLRAITSMAFLARAWARSWPIEGTRERLIAAAVRCAQDRDEVVRLQGATLLRVIEPMPPSSLPTEAQEALRTLMQNQYVAHEIGRQLEIHLASLPGDDGAGR